MQIKSLDKLSPSGDKALFLIELRLIPLAGTPFKLKAANICLGIGFIPIRSSIFPYLLSTYLLQVDPTLHEIQVSEASEISRSSISRSLAPQ